MVIVNTQDGRSHSFDLERDRAALDTLLSSGRVTALSILNNGTRHSLPRPKRFGSTPLVFGAELLRATDADPIGEMIFVHVGEVRVSLSVPYSGKAARADLVRLGRLRYNPRRV